MSCWSKLWLSFLASSIKDCGGDGLFVNGHLAKSWTQSAKILANWLRAAPPPLILYHSPALAGSLQCGLIAITQFVGDLNGFAAPLEQSECLQQLPLLLQLFPCQRYIATLLPLNQGLSVAAGQSLPALLKRFIILWLDEALLQLIEDHLQAVAISPLPLLRPLPQGKGVEQSIEQGRGLQPASLLRLGHAQRDVQLIVITTAERAEGGQRIGTEPEAAASWQQEFMLTKSQQRRTPGDPQQLSDRRAFAVASLQAVTGKMVILDGVMHVKTLI